MKRIHSLFRYLVAVLLSALTVLPASAQRVQNALYIFRNDGQFHAFFYGDIDRISYSRIDTLGVEHDDYVVQEVWALDTVYRIPVSAIDSVSFVTPENKVQDDVFCPDKSISDYIIASDSVWWILLSPETPKGLIPKVGDKLLIEQSSEFIPHGFGGRVFVSEMDDDGWLVATEPTPITDIYERLVINEAAATPAAQRRRMEQRSHRIIDGTISLDVPEKTIDLTTLVRELTFDKNVVSTPEGKPFTIAANITGTAKVALDIDLTYRSHLFIDPLSGFQTDVKTQCDVKFNGETSLAGSLKARLDVGFPKKTWDVGPLNLVLEAGVYVEGALSGYEVKASYSFDGSLASHCYMNQDDIDALYAASYKPNVNIGGKVRENKFEFENNLPFLKEGPSQIPNTITITVGAAAKVGTLLGMPIEKAKNELHPRLLKFMENYAFGEKKDSVGFNCEVGLDMGAKIEVKAPWDLLWRDTPLLESQPFYIQLDKESSAKGSLFFQTGANINMGPWKLARPWEWSVSTDPLGLVPDISALRVTTDEEANPVLPYRKHFFAPIKRDLMQNVDIGFLVVDEDHEEVIHNTDLSWGSSDIFDKGFDSFNNGGYHMYFNVDPGRGDKAKYTAYPLVKLATGRELIASASFDFETEPARFDIAQRVMTVDEKGGYDGFYYIGPHEIEVIPNMENVEVTSVGDWIRDVSFLNHLNKLNFYWDDLPSDVRQRRAVIYLKGLSQKGIELVEDSIVINQGRAYLEIDPKEMQFDAAGGTKQATITETNLTDLKVISYQDFVRPSLNGNIITINVTPNTGESRETDVHVQGKGPDGMTYEDLIRVKQTGVDPDPDNPVVNDAPFKFITFMTERMARYVSDTNPNDTIVPVVSAFSFRPENYTKFEKTREGNIIHFVVEGYEEHQTANETKSAARLTFDVDKKEEMIRNLSFSLESNSVLKVRSPLYISTTTTKLNVSLTLADFPLMADSPTWMSTTNYTAAEGLQSTSYSFAAEMYTTYEDPLFGNHIDPISEYITYEPVGDSGDNVSLWISLNEENSDLAWPTDEVMQSLRNGGMPIYEGDTPPSVMGTYLVSPLQIVSDPTGEVAEEIEEDMGLVIKLNSLGDGKITYDSYFVFDDIATSNDSETQGLIMGSGDSFTICIPIDTETTILMSGRIQDGNIVDFHFANTSPDIVGRHAIIKDTDGLSTPTDWSPGSEDDF
jgi:hypothetical protein